MLQIIVPADVVEDFDERTSKFIYTTIAEAQPLRLEHSLVSLAQWESKWNKPFLSKKDKTHEEVLDYIQMMTLDKNVDPMVYTRLSAANYKAIHEYIKAPMTATTFSNNENDKPNRQIITAEIIYHWMIALNIPFECQHWHLNRLLTLVRVCNIKNAPKKGNKRKSAVEYARMNAARKKPKKG